MCYQKACYHASVIFPVFNVWFQYLLFPVGRKPKTQQSPISNGSPELGIKKKPREGKGNFGGGLFCRRDGFFFSQVHL